MTKIITITQFCHIIYLQKLLNVARWLRFKDTTQQKKSYSKEIFQSLWHTETSEHTRHLKTGAAHKEKPFEQVFLPRVQFNPSGNPLRLKTIKTETTVTPGSTFPLSSSPDTWCSAPLPTRQPESINSTRQGALCASWCLHCEKYWNPAHCGGPGA